MDFGILSFSTLCKIYSVNILSGRSCVDAGFCVSLELYLRIELLGCMMTLLSPFKDSFPK